MQRLLGINTIALAALTTSCFNPPDFLNKDGSGQLITGDNTISVAVVEVEAEVVQGSIKGGAQVTQTITAAKGSALAGAKVAFPPGSLALDTDITVQEGISFIDESTKLALGLQSDAISEQSVPMVISSSAKKDPIKPFTLALPLPTGSGLRLINEDTYWAVMYTITVFADGSNRTGIIPTKDLVLQDGAVSFAANYFGVYTLVQLKQEVTSKVTVTTERPIVTKSAAEKDTTPPGPFSIQGPVGMNPQPITVRWSKATDAVNYNLAFSQNGDCSAPYLAKIVGDVDNVSIEGLKEGVSFLCMKAMDAVANGIGANNNPFTISIAPPSTQGPSAPPPPPQLAAPQLHTFPVSPHHSLNFHIRGTAPSGTQVDVFENGTCSGMPMHTVDAAVLSGNGVPFYHAVPATKKYSARARNSSASSQCSMPITYSNPTMLADISPSSGSSIDPYEFHAGLLPNGKFVVTAAASSSDRKPWVINSDGTFSLLKDINAGMGSYPREYFNFNGLVYFQATSSSEGGELWATNGTDGGTSLIIDINTGSTGSNPGKFFTYNNLLYFKASGTNEGEELFFSDGSTANVMDINAGANSSYPGTPFIYNGKFYLAADHGSSYGTELVRINPTDHSFQLVSDLAPGSLGSNPEGFRIHNGELYFSADDGVDGRELFKMDASETITKVHDFTGDSMPSSAVIMGSLNNELIVAADDGTGVWNLWKISTGAPQFITNIPYNPFRPVQAGNYIYFANNDGPYGEELWRTDGTAAGTFMLKDIKPGSMGSNPSKPIPVGNYVYFLAKETDNNFLYRSDGTSTGTEKVSEYGYYCPSMCYEPIQHLGDSIIFASDDMTHGVEPWIVHVGP